MKMKVICLFAVLLSACFVGCSAEGPPGARMAHSLIGRNADHMKRVYECSLTGIGGAFMGGVNGLNVSLICYRPTSVEEAREMFVEGAGKLLKETNSLEALKPHLKDGALTISDLEYRIHFAESQDHNGFWGGAVTLVQNVGDILIYSTLTSNRLDADLVTVHEESFGEAVRIVEEARKVSK